MPKSPSPSLPDRPILSPHEVLRLSALILWKRRLSLVLTFVVSLAVILFGVYLIEPAYVATTKILVQFNPQQQLILFPGMESPKPISHQINPAHDLLELATSRGMAMSIVRKFNLDRPKELIEPRDYIKHWLKVAVKSPLTLARKLKLLNDEASNHFTDALDELMEDMQDIRVRRDTKIIDVTIWARMPDLATGIANEVADQLIVRMRDLTRGQAFEKYVFARDQAVLAEKSLREAERDLTRFRLSESIFALQQERELLLNRINLLRDEKIMADTTLQETVSRAAQLDAQIERQEPIINSAFTQSANPVIKDLQIAKHDASSELAALRIERGLRHPEVFKLQARVRELQAQIDQEPTLTRNSETSVRNPIHQDLIHQRVQSDVEMAALTDRSRLLKEEISKLERQMGHLSEMEPLYEQKLREKTTQEERLRTLKTKELELEVQQLTETSDFDIRLLDAAVIVPNSDPDYPDWESAVIIALVVSLAAALGAPFLLEYLSDVIDTPRDVEVKLGFPVLGTIPRSSIGIQSLEQTLRPSSNQA